MIPRIGPMEVILILGLAIVLFGPKKLPELGRSLGRTLREFRKSTREPEPEEEIPEELAETGGKAGSVR